ncbi:MAG: hypothetical protein MJ228_04530 [Bacilli bacterium]|nr:hypothetical protein [Bacilli bacterium]
MKKLALFLALPLTIISLGSCSKQSNEILYLPYGKLCDENIEENEGQNLLDYLDVIDETKLESKIKNKDSFILLSFDDNSSSKSIKKFMSSFASYLRVANAPVFFVSRSGNENESLLSLYRGGKEIHRRETKGENDAFNSFGGIASWMDERTSISDMLYVNENQLDSLFEKSDQFTVGFLREGCPDCTYLKESVLYNYNKNHNNTSYLVDCDSLSEGFKDKYGLTSSSNEDYGYDSGYVPTFVRYAPAGGNKAESIVDAAVYLNDKVTFEGGKYTVSTSYYSEARKDILGFFGSTKIDTKVIEGMTLDESKINKISDDYFMWKREEAAKFHNPIIKAFLDAYVSIKK